MAFESLSDKLNIAFKKLRGKGIISEADINEAIEDNDGDPNITGIPLNCDFSDFVQNYSTRNPFGPIEYVALGFGDEGITFYKVVEEPNMEIYGTG